MQTKEELEQFYSLSDPWGYQTNDEDTKRKNIILNELGNFEYFKRALDIGCGEGWITKDLPAKKIYGMDLSDNAVSRLPNNVTAVKKPFLKYDLIIATGVLYQQYDVEKILELIKKHAKGIVLTCNIKDWEINNLPIEKQMKEFEFQYREYTQKLRIYNFAS